MTAQILNSELSNLIQESKRKHSELRHAAEKSLEDLKSLRSTSEAQVAADLSNRPNFVTAFLIACGTKNAKFTGIAIVCLQRLVASRALPRSRLKEVLEAFREASSGSLDVQLKILQSLPALLQNYGEDLQGDLLAATLNVCTLLQASKNGIVNNTAAATLQQLVVAVFDKVVAEDKISLEVPTIAEAPAENGSVQVRAAAFDAYRVFNDLCLLTESQKPKFLRTGGLPQTFGLELIESVLTNHVDIFLGHPEQAHILRSRVMPFIVSSLSEKISFATSVRIVRILYTLLRRHLSILASEAEMALGLLTHMLDADTALWKRALCMEVLRGLFAEASLIRQIHSLYDAQEGRKNVLTNLVATFVRLSSEKPSVIGLGAQSTMPTQSRYTSNSESTDQAVLEASGIPGIISSPLATGEANVGISMQWSSMRVPCIDQLDKQEPPAIPESYIYSLALTCINSFSEGLAQFILPLTVPKKGRADRGTSFKKNPVPLNPLDLEEHPLFEDVKACSGIIETCWPAILATCSTFLYASLDADYYHGLVRSFQKFTHVAGLLRLSTPRDAFLTTLGKASVPPNVFSATSGTAASGLISPSAEQHQSIFSNARGLLSVDSLSSNATGGSDRSRQQSTSDLPPTLNTRNMLCLRALLNLGIALGPTLDVAWSIILECLQQADFVLFTSARGAGRSPISPGLKPEAAAIDNTALLANFGTEIKAVETAASRLFESTVDFPNSSFLDVVSALCKLFGGTEIPESGESPTLAPSGAHMLPRKGSHTHRRVFSISTTSPSQNQEDFFALSKLGDVASINIERLMSNPPDKSGWEVITSELIDALVNTGIDAPVRLRAAEVLVKIVQEAAANTVLLPEDVRGGIQLQLLDTFKKALEPLQQHGRVTSVSSNVTDIDVHKIILEGLRNILEHCGETLVSGWDIAFEIIGSVFVHRRNSSASVLSLSQRRPTSRSARLVKSSFNSLQLICSDFLSAVPTSCFFILVDTLYNFCTQDDDLNICLTTVTFFWVLSDFISNRSNSFGLSSDLLKSADEQVLKTKAASMDRATSAGALWILLLLRLTVVTTDDRLELRNSAIQTLLRIFDANGDQLSPEAWSMCLQSVIYKMFSSMETRLHATADPENNASESEKLAWIDTTVVVLNGVSSLLATYLHVLSSHATFATCWQSLLSHFSALLECEQLAINTAIFKALKVILAQANTESEASAILGKEPQDLAWRLWSQGLPLPTSTVIDTKMTNQACLTAYVSSLQEIYRLIKHEVDVKQTRRILELLRETIQRANAEAYSADVEYLTALQTQVLQSLKLIRTDIPGVPSAMITQAAELVDLAFQHISNDEPQSKTKPTYVALSKAAMSLLETLILTNAEDVDIYMSSALTSALTALSQPVGLKYAFPTRTKSIQPWRLASTTSISILTVILPKIAKSSIPDEETRKLWTAIISIANGIMIAEPPSSLSATEINFDQDFDVSSFLAIRDLITPALGSLVIPDKVRSQYTKALFHTSFIHAPAVTDLPKPGETLTGCLKKPRRGRTIDPTPSSRKKMSYICLEELFSLVSIQPPVSEKQHDECAEQRAKLAQSAAPYLLLRCGLSLKSYAADQPLRGLCPQPLSQKKELALILDRLAQLRCIEEAIPEDVVQHDAMGSGEKKHLIALYGLLTQAVGVDKGMGGEEVQGRVKETLAVVGGELRT